jgi:hypothetical protein
MVFGRRDRAQARAHLSLPAEATVISLIPGAWATEERAPIAQLVLPAFESLGAPNKKLVWVAGREQQTLAARLQQTKDVLVVGGVSPVEALMVASDVVITKANRGTTLELAALEVPSISISYERNAIDEAALPRIPTNTPLLAAAIDASALADVLRQVIATSRVGGVPPGPPVPPRGAREAAVELARFLDERAARRVAGCACVSVRHEGDRFQPLG